MTSTRQGLSPALARIKKELPLGKRVIWARKRKGLSQEALAAAIGTSRRHMIRIEKGFVKQPGPAFTAKIAEATDCPRELFEDEDQEDDRAMSFDDFLLRRVRSLMREEQENNEPSGSREEASLGSSTTGG